MLCGGFPKPGSLEFKFPQAFASAALNLLPDGLELPFSAAFILESSEALVSKARTLETLALTPLGFHSLNHQVLFQVPYKVPPYFSKLMPGNKFLLKPD